MQEKRKKLLTISDAISAQTGLGRIHHDLVINIHDNLSDVYDLATMGYGGIGTSKIHVPQFPCEGMVDWVLPSLPQVIEDFAGSERCIVMFVWDAHRVRWFAQPKRLGGDALAKFPGLKGWLVQANLEKWIYVPIDSSGPFNKLSLPIALTLLGFDRILAYGPYGESVIRRTIGDEESDKRHLTNLPHGYNADDFYPLDRNLCRRLFLQYTQARSLLNMLGVEKVTKPIENDEVIVSICGTNQQRKSWPVALEACAILAKTHKLRVWCHVDVLERSFSIPTLLVDYGLVHNSIISLDHISDQKLSAALCAADICIMAGPEGFGLVGLESLAVGTPVITGSVAGAADFVPRDMQIDPVWYYEEGSFGSRRPVYKASDFAAKAEEWIGRRADIPDQYNWGNLWHQWDKWFRQ